MTFKITFKNRALISKTALNMSLDSAQGINANSVIQLWSCHNYTSS